MMRKNYVPLRFGHSSSRKTGLLLATCLGLCLLTGCNFPTVSAANEPPPDATAQMLITVPSEYLTNPRIVSHDPFDNTRNWKFETDTGALTDGVFAMQGTAGWASHLWFKRPFAAGEGLLLRYRVRRANAQSELVFVAGEWRTATFRQFGVYNSARPSADLFHGLDDLGGYAVAGNLTIQPGTWYELLLAIGRNAHFLAVVWDPNDESQHAVFDLVGVQDWMADSWTFLPKANEGETLYVDDLYRITFGDIK